MRLQDIQYSLDLTLDVDEHAGDTGLARVRDGSGKSLPDALASALLSYLRSARRDEIHELALAVAEEDRLRGISDMSELEGDFAREDRGR